MKSAFRYLITIYVVIIVVNIGVIFPQLNTNPLERGLLLICGIVFLMGRRIDLVVLSLIGVMFAATIVCAMGTEYYGFTVDRYLRGAVSLLTPWLLLAGSPDERDRDLLVKLLALMPVSCVGLGFLYTLVGLYDFYPTTYGGVHRLQGTSIAAGLGSMAYVGVFAAVLGWATRRSKAYGVLAAANIVILLLSAARGPFVLVVPVLIVTAVFMYRHTLRSVVSWTFAAPIGGLCLFAFAGGSMLSRLSEGSSSGRELIWSSLRSVVEAYPVFGVGLGHQILVIPPQVAIITSTVAAHDEYLRILVECGYFGAAIIFPCLVGIFVRVWTSKRVSLSPVFLVAAASFMFYCTSDNAISSSVSFLIVVMASFAFANTTPRRGAASRIARDPSRHSKIVIS